MTTIPTKIETFLQLTEYNVHVQITKSLYVVVAILYNCAVHMRQYQLLSVLAARLSPLNIDRSRNLPVEICGINYTEKYTNL